MFALSLKCEHGSSLSSLCLYGQFTPQLMHTCMVHGTSLTGYHVQTVHPLALTCHSVPGSPISL